MSILFDQWWDARWYIRYATVFIVLRNGWNWVKKTDFLAHLHSFFGYALLYPTSFAPTFCELKEFIKIELCVRFYQCRICGCEVSSFSPNLCLILLPPSKFWILAQIERTQSLQFLSILGPNLLPKNQKYCEKPDFLPKLPADQYP